MPVDKPEFSKHPVRSVAYLNKGDELPTYYANNAEFFITNWDMRFRFGHIETIENSEISIKNILTVFMSIEHARVFIAKAKESLDRWDEANAKKEG
jgi:hypothetical protein